MTEKSRNDVSDGVSWWGRQCKGRKSIREGSFFSNSRLTLQQWLLLIYWWARQYPVTDAANEANVDRGTACDVYRWLWEVCSSRLLTTPIMLGGPGVVVQIDESLYHHKPKVIYNIVTLLLLCFHIDSRLGAGEMHLKYKIFGTCTLSVLPFPLDN